MTEQTDVAEAAPDETIVESPAVSTPPEEATVLETVAEVGTSPEQAETTTATDGESQGEEAGAPESYEFEAPEGVAIDKDSALIAAYSDFAKSRNLTQEQAQEGFAALAKAQAQQAETQRETWVKGMEEETRADPVLGGDNLKNTMVKADQVLATFDKDRKLTALLNETGLKWSKPMVALLTEVRNAISDDQFIAGNTGEQKKERTAQDFYANSKMNP